MKRIVFLLAISIAVSTFAGEKVEIKTDSPVIKASVKAGVCQLIEDGKVISMRGYSTSKNNAWRSIITPLPYKDPAGKKFKFGGEIKVEKIAGKFSIAVRMINDKDKSITYSFYTLTKDTGWKKFSREFTAAPGTVKMQLYILGQKLGDETRVCVKDLYVEAID